MTTAETQSYRFTSQLVADLSDDENTMLLFDSEPLGLFIPAGYHVCPACGGTGEDCIGGDRGCGVCNKKGCLKCQMP